MTSPVWRRAGFVKLWSAQVASLLGTQVSALAVPLTAVVFLDATPTDMGIQAMLWTGGMVVAALLAGSWVDRSSRRRIMVTCDVGRAVVLLSVPAAAVTGVLSIEQLWLVALVFSMLTAAFNVANYALLPSLVDHGDLVAANSALEASRSVIAVAGPGLAGPLIKVLSAPLALAVDAISYLGSALLLTRIRSDEPPASVHRSLWADITAGITFVVGDRILRAIAIASGTFVFFLQFFTTLHIWYLTNRLGLGPIAIGVLAALGGLAATFAATLAARLVRRAGLNTVMVGSLLLSGAGGILVPLAAGSKSTVLAVLGLGAMLNGVGSLWYNVNATSLRQAITPDDILGRVNATMRFAVMAPAPLAAIVAGTAAEHLGARTVLVSAAIGQALAILALLASPIRQLRRIPSKGE